MYIYVLRGDLLGPPGSGKSLRLSRDGVLVSAAVLARHTTIAGAEYLVEVGQGVESAAESNLRDIQVCLRKH